MRTLQVMIDKDLAEIYGVDTKVLNQAVKRNINRFPNYFRFQITETELLECSRSQIVTLNNDYKNANFKRGQNIKYLPNEQYPAIDIKIMTNSHDRFLIIDELELYHIGSSLKDLGKKWFAFSKMDSLTTLVLNKLK